ncbi:MAG TPA: SH3 domain-containing protein, partial [Chloroflexi bacterium]|nr:SH3 domain-containing protein [Chloroflexota bacterium]
MKRFRLTLLFVALMLALSALACNLPGAHPTRPTVTIQSPESGVTVPVNEPLIISSLATDTGGPGVARVELFVNGESVRVDESPAGGLTVFDLAQTWVPDTEGEATITVIAYREDGTPSNAATITVTVAGLTPAPPQTPPPGLSPSALPPTGSPEEATAAIVQGRVVTPANIRSGPGPFCSIIGTADAGTILNLLEYSRDRLWFKTDYLGPDRVGWISIQAVAPQSDTSLIPRGDRTGCQGCGDGACNLQETCFDCPEDCGECCGNAVCEPDYGEDCGTCEADCGPCCGNGLCEAERGEDCGTCEADCGPCCGNAVCEPGRGEDCGT